MSAALEYANEDEGWGNPVIPPFVGKLDMSRHLIESLMAEGLDLATGQEMIVDHGLPVPMQLFWPIDGRTVPKIIPLCMNEIQSPFPSRARCFKRGQALGRAIESYPEDLNVVIVGTGGMSHQLDGQGAGFINREFDLLCMEKRVHEPEYFLGMSIVDLVRVAGAQGAEFIMWMKARGALTGDVKNLHSNYHAPFPMRARARCYSKMVVDNV